MRRILTPAGLACFLLLAAETASAQNRAWGGYLGFGIPVPVGSTDDFLGSKTAWNFGAIYSPPAAAWGLRLDIGFSRFAIDNQAVIDQFGGSDGYARTWDLGLALEVGTPKSKPGRFYVIAGAGAVNRYAAVTDPTIVGGCYWDPWWGYICGSGVADEVLVDQDTWAFGVNGGLGISYKIQRGPAIFVEGRYRVAMTKNEENATGNASGINTTYVPITFGLRW